MNTDKVTVAILAKNMGFCMNEYLDMVYNLDYPKSSILLYIRTNNNTDNTVSILEEWLSKHQGEYLKVHYDSTDIDTKVEQYGNHEWNSTRFTILAKIRQDSIEWALENNSHYFVIDCDNFVIPSTLQTLLYTRMPVIGPLVRISKQDLSQPDPASEWYANYHHTVCQNGYYADKYQCYGHLLNQHVKGLIQVDTIHCTYLIRNEYLKDCTYIDGTNDYEYVIFSRNLRKKNIPQYLDNRQIYGYLTFFTTRDGFLSDTKLQQFLCKNTNEFTTIYRQKTWLNGTSLSGPGSDVEYTAPYRAFLEEWVQNKQITSICDIGCGDFTFTKHINWNTIKYTGIDIVEDVIQSNIELYPNVSFLVGDVCSKDFLDTIPEYDLIIMKDVIQHWPSKYIKEILPQIRKKCKYLLICNCRHQKNNWHDISTFGDFRPLNYKMLPMSIFKPELVFSFESKDVVLIP